MQAFAAEPELKLPPDHAERLLRGTELFTKQIKPILTASCLKCHGAEKAEAKLDLSSREALLKGSENGKVVVPFDAAQSEIMKYLRHEKEPYMPDEMPKLSDEKLAQITQWINLGAPYDSSLAGAEAQTAWITRKIDPKAKEYWAFQPLKLVGPPSLLTPWCKTDVDYFVFKALQDQRLSPNPPVDKRRLIRRVYFDLIGLPPTADEVEAFVKDESPEAYAKLIDRLLESPHYGERWGRYWLDVARFGESHGFEQDYDRPFAYHYRDFVIKALNQDMPYTQFVRWQLAGDELAPNDPLALMGTGFLGAGVFPTQITANEVERTRYDAIDDMAATVGTSMLGLTIGCARCHDHKFDPIPQADYYRFMATFTTTVRSEVALDLVGNAGKLTQAFEAEHAPLVAARERFEKEELPGRLAAWEKSGAAGTNAAAKPSGWSVPEYVSYKSEGGATLAPVGDGSLLASEKNPDFDTYTIVVRTSQPRVKALRLEALAHPSMVKGGPGRAGNGNIALTDFRATALPADEKLAKDAKPVAIKFTNPRATFEQAPSLLAKYAIDDDKKSAWALDPQFGKDHALALDLEGEVGFPGGTVLTLTLEFKNNNQHNIGRPRVSLAGDGPPPALVEKPLPQAVAAALSLPAEQRTAEQKAAALAWFRTQDDEWRRLDKVVADHEAKRPKPPLTKVQISSEGITPIRHHTQGADFFPEFFYLKRGDINQKQGQASQSFLQALMQGEDIARWKATPPAGSKTSGRRTTLANWMTDTDRGAGALLARVAVNRVWHHHFGRGIVASPNDFGAQGERPTHPELLDWLAQWFIDHNWKLKDLHRLLMTSAVYQQSANFDAAKAKADPQNRWLWRYAPRRLEAELIRDNLLAISGQLDRTQFGPGTLDEGHKRRSIYFMIKRSKLIPQLAIFDAPEPLVSVGSRPTTTVAPQALMFMNSPHVRGYAHAMAAKLLPAAEKSWNDAVSLGYRTALGRDPSGEELQDTAAFLAAQSESYTAEKKPNARQLALADFCQVLFGLNELVYVE